MEHEIKIRYYRKKITGIFEVREFSLSEIEDGIFKDWADAKLIKSTEIRRSLQTGLKDKNLKEIYEGDIVGKPERTASGLLIAFPVVFYNGSFCVKHGKYRPAPPSKGFWTQNEILGNIYQTPELLTNA